MRLPYPDLIRESVADLLRLERWHRRTPLESRVKMLRLLKEGTYSSRQALAPVLGFSERQLDRWFKAYREGGLDALLDYRTPPGRTERVTPEAWAGLEAQMLKGRIRTLEQARRYLADEHGIHYAGITSISMLFQRRGVKLKTGRPRDRRTSAEAQAAFKK
jgi:transposase